jgi:hypothetical protein
MGGRRRGRASCGAGLLLRTLIAMGNIDAYQSDNVLIVQPF